MSKEKAPFDHVLDARQFQPTWLIKEFFPETDTMKFIMDEYGFEGSLRNKSFCIFFVEPSTRTRISFEQAIEKLGASFSSTENAKASSSLFKGESLTDTIRTINSFRFDGIIMRHNEEGGANKAAVVSEIPIINAGDGIGQHPTQALLDAYTIYRQLGHLDNLRIALVGDLKHNRTTSSLTYLLGQFNDVCFDFVAPAALQMKEAVIQYCNSNDIRYRSHSKLIDIAGKVDVIYLTRLQIERLQENVVFSAEDLRLTHEVLNKLQEHTIIMHPLPRNNQFGELPEEFTDHPRVLIFQQVENGLYTRMALLKMITKS